MSSRALRKLQREQELQKQLAAAQEAEEDAEESDEDSQPVATTSQPRNAFDVLEDGEDGESDADSDRGTPLKPANSSPASHIPSSPHPVQPSKSKKKRKKAKKKNKEPASKTPPAKEDSGDEIDRALKELSVKRPVVDGADSPDDALSNWEASAARHLAIDPRNFNPSNEMRSLFGSVALEGDSRSSPRNQRRREQNQQGGVDLATGLTGRYSVASRGKELGSLAHRRNVFMQGKEEWPLAASGGLSMEHAKDPESFERRYNIVHNAAYSETQRGFRRVVESMDPQRMIALLTIHPYHIATLLQVSEIAKHQGDHSVSGDLLERALFNFGRSVHSTFPSAMRDGTARLSFDTAANRELYLAIWRYLRNLEMRGTWKTAFEWAKLLLQLNTISDPYGVTLMIDQLALRGRSHEQFIQMASDEGYGNAWRHLPNIQISLVLAYLRSKQPREARKQLALCIHQYPYIISALASAVDITPLPKSLWAKLPTTDGEKLYTELYVSRAKDLWNTPENSGLIVEVADTLSYYTSTTDHAPPVQPLEISLEEARHIMLLETPQLIALLPRRFTSLPTSSFDVLPPPSSLADSDFTARAPADASGASALQAIFNAGAATAGATGNNIVQSLMNFRNWFNSPATVGDDTIADDEGRAALRDLQRELSREGMSPDMIEQFLRTHMANDEPDDADDFAPANTHAMAGGWDYYAERADGRDGSSQSSADDEGHRANDSMPELEDVPTNTTQPSAAQTPPQQPQRNPRAAMVEEDDDEDPFNGRDLHRPVIRTAAGQPILRHIDSDSDSEPEIAGTGAHLDPNTIASYPTDPAHNPFVTATELHRRSQQTQSQSQPHVQPQPQPHLSAQQQQDSDIESSTERLQRWLLTTGLMSLLSDSSHATMDLYVRRLKMLRRQQQAWILGIIEQRNKGDKAVEGVVERVRRESAVEA